MKNTYRIEIPSKFIEAAPFTFWIGKGMELVNTKAEAIEVTEAESLAVMEKIDCVATCYKEAN